MLDLIEHNQDEATFHFWQPLQKGSVKEGKGGRRILEGVAATPERDTHGETLAMAGLDISYFLEHGKINWEHRKNPEDIIGVPLTADVNPHRMFIRAELWPAGTHKRADAAWELAQASAASEKPAMGWSVEGKTLGRSLSNRSNIVKAMVVNVALTANPVNTNTYADLVKAMCAPLVKDMGGMSTVSGAALVPQDLEGLVRKSPLLAKHYALAGQCGCHDAAGNFVGGHAGALNHFKACLGAPLLQADTLARSRRLLAGGHASFNQKEK